MNAISHGCTRSFNASNHPACEGLELPADTSTPVTQEQAEYLRHLAGVEVTDPPKTPKKGA